MLNKYIFPTWKQFKKWSLPSKITLYGTLTGIIFGIFAVYTFYSDKKSEDDKTYLINIATELSSTIAEVRELLPNNIAYENCINNSKYKDYDKKFEECILSIKQNSLEASIKLKKVISKFQPLLRSEDYNNLEEIYKKIDYTIYEIQNNQYVIGKWTSNSCPESIDIICEKSTNSLTKDVFDKNIGCILSVEYYGSFLERMETNNDIISTIKDSTIKIDRVKCFIIPGSTSTINKYFHGMNNQLVKKYILDTEELKNTVKSIISRS